MYLAQKLVKTKNDWEEIVEKDKTYFELELSDEEISVMKKNKYTRIVDTAMNKQAMLS